MVAVAVAQPTALVEEAVAALPTEADKALLKVLADVAVSAALPTALADVAVSAALPTALADVAVSAALPTALADVAVAARPAREIRPAAPPLLREYLINFGERDPEEDPHFQEDNGFNSPSTHQQITGVTNMECDVDENRDDGAANLASCTESSLLAHIHLYGSYIKGMMSNQESGISEIQNSIKTVVENMTQDISEDMYQLLQMDRYFRELAPSGLEVQSTNYLKEVLRVIDQQWILQAQQRNINRLVTIQENVQDTAAMVFAELVDPVHHLFVVLPFEYSSGSYNGFRLFFLCEHGQQSTTGNRASLPNIHLARHEGYELQDPGDFFKDYAPYLVSIFHILKNGIASPGFNIPSLSHTTLADGVVEVQDILNLSDNTIQSLMNETISYMHDQGYQDSMKRMNSRLALDVIESTDLHSILRYLKCYKKNVITSGKFKWVCTDHYREKYLGATQEYQDGDDGDDVYEDNMDEDMQSMDDQSHDVLVETTLLDGLNSMEWTDREKTVIALNGRAQQKETVLRVIIGAVADPDKDVREAAVRVLHEPSKVSRSARDAVIRAVYDAQWNVQEAAVQVLGDLPLLSGEMANVIDVLGYAAESSHLHVKRAATEALINHATSESVLQHLVGIIRSGTHMNKVVATEVLATQSMLPETVVEALIETLGNDSQEVRNSAAFALQSQCNLPRSVVQRLLEKVQDEASGIRDAAVHVLGNQLETPESVLSALIASLQDDSRDVQEAAIQALSNKSDLPQHTIQELTSTLSHERVSVREASAKVLRGQSTLSEATIQALTVTLNDESPSVREAAVQALGSQFQQSQLVIDALVSILDDHDPKVRAAAVHSIGCKMKPSRSAVRALIRMLNDDDVDVQQKAIQALRGLAALFSEVPDALVRFLESEDEVIRTITINALSGTAQLSDATMEKLVANLQDGRPTLRRATVEVLSSHIKRSETAVDALVDATSDNDSTVSHLAFNALRGLVKLSERAIRKLIANKQTYTRSAQLDFIQLLGDQVNSSEDAVAVLLTFLGSPIMTVMSTAENALNNLTSIPDSALQVLKGLLHDEDWLIRKSALRVLGKHVRTSEAAALTALHALGDTNQDIKDTALEILHKNGLPIPVVLLQLERLKSGDRTARDTAVSILNGLPIIPSNAVQTLLKYLKDDDKEIREAAASVLNVEAKVPTKAKQSARSMGPPGTLAEYRTMSGQKRQLTKEEELDIVRYHQAGLTYRQMSKLLGIPVSSVYRVIMAEQRVSGQKNPKETMPRD
ncbi:hypothetical protein BGX34_009923 [Mortierella sp. NVP85]|nr:hypothetical protein BGX34_009923 [Mortierella sp. NVP85]